MELHLNWFNSLVLFGVIQGIIFSVLVNSKRNHPGAGFLAAFFLVLAYNGLETFSWSSGLSNYTNAFDLLEYVFVFALGPCLYLYLNSLFTCDIVTSKHKVFVHFVLMCFQFFLQLSIYLYHVISKNEILDLGITAGQLHRFYGIYSEPLSLISFLVYLVASIRMAKKYRQTESMKGKVKEMQMTIMRWSYFLLIAMSILSILWAATIISNYWLNFPESENYFFIEIALVFFIYWTAIIGYQKISLIRQKNIRPGIAEFELQRHLKSLCSIMENDKMHLDPELSQLKVSSKTGIPIKTISLTLNKLNKSNFTEFVNAYRVEEVRKRLEKGECRHITIAAIAIEAGFNSQATFQRAFKNKTGISPTEYIATLEA